MKILEGRPYLVLLLDNDEEAVMVADFETVDEAREAYDKPKTIPELLVCLDDATIIQLEGPDVMQARELHPRGLKDAWQREIAMQDGMVGGCDAYNEAMGWPIEEKE